jgi:hypothetical protein
MTRAARPPSPRKSFSESPPAVWTAAIASATGLSAAERLTRQTSSSVPMPIGHLGKLLHPAERISTSAYLVAATT